MKIVTHNALIMITAYAGIISSLLLPLSLTAHEKCELCHISPSPTEQDADLVGSLPFLCIDCHQERTGSTEHVISVIPTGTTGTLPLINGRLGCTTCHDPHGTTPMQLRVSADKLCLICHQY